MDCMHVGEYSRLDATALAALIRSGDLRPEEALELAREAHLTARDRLGPAVVDFYANTDDGRSTPRAFPVDQPFSGVPMMLKDIGATERGRLSEHGSALYYNHRASETSLLTEKFMAAGLRNVGRTATSELALAATVETALHGTVRNPWEASLSTLGSSGGAAAAVAAGIVPLAHGTDSGGSIRMPASACGVVGLKPSRGRVSSAPGVGLPGDLTVEFAITKSVRDAALLLDCVSGPSSGDRHSSTAAISYREVLKQPPPRLKIALTTDHYWGRPIDPECVAAATYTARLCADLGHSVSEVAVALDAEPWITAMLDVWSACIAHEVFARGDDDEMLEGLTRAWCARGRDMPARRLVEAVEALNSVSQQAAALFEGFDVVLGPTLPTLPPALGVYDPGRDVSAEWYFDSPIGNMESSTSLFNVTGQPAMSLPLMQSASGLPIGIQIAARQYREDVLLALAAQLEYAAPWDNALAPAHVSRLLPATNSASTGDDIGTG